MYHRDMQYSAKVISMECELFKVSATMFEKLFPRAIKPFMNIADLRYNLMNEMFLSNRMQNEMRCLKYNNKLPLSKQKNLSLFQANKFKD